MNDNYSNIKNRTVLVTGAGGGIGRSIALHFAQSGASFVLINDLPSQQSAADETVSMIRALGYQADTALWDVSNYDVTMAEVGVLKKTYGGTPVDILINNAGITRDMLFARMSKDLWDKALSVNTGSVFNCSKAFVPGMSKNRWGRIISLSSIVAFTGNVGQTNYSASKAAIVGFTKSLALEYAGRGITINAVAPGFIDTDMTQKMPEDVKKAFLAKIPVGRMGTVDDVARAVLYLANEEYLTGQIIHVNGGLYL